MLHNIKRGIPLRNGLKKKKFILKVLQKMYRHESVITRMNYQSNFSFKKADEAIDAVLDF
ncbi:MAG: hypothetical protein JST50_13095 [Bacteroidetes bacterium]|nr:hypothetical protein [Bacteroidota bacterium]